MIELVYRSVDGCRERKSFKTLVGAMKFAHRMVGEHPEMGHRYAVSGDGIGKIEIAAGASMGELFPERAAPMADQHSGDMEP